MAPVQSETGAGLQSFLLSRLQAAIVAHYAGGLTPNRELSLAEGRLTAFTEPNRDRGLTPETKPQCRLRKLQAAHRVLPIAVRYNERL